MFLLLIATSLLNGCITADNRYPHHTGYDKYIPKNHISPRDNISTTGSHDTLIPQSAYRDPKSEEYKRDLKRFKQPTPPIPRHN